MLPDSDPKLPEPDGPVPDWHEPSDAHLIVAGDPDARLAPFPRTGARPGVMDKRCILQDQIWVGPENTTTRLTDMTPEERQQILDDLRQHETVWPRQARDYVYEDAVRDLIPPEEARRRLEVLDQLTPGWVDHTPLGRRLHQLNRTHPRPWDTPPRLTTAQASDHPHVLHDADHGIWEIATHTGSTYLLDLDQRRVLRLPAPADTTSTAAQGSQPEDRRVPLPDDGEWTPVTNLIHCTVGRRLFLFDDKNGTGGYRISTSITHINRIDHPQPTPAMPDSAETAHDRPLQ